jgi:hypothetical protein
LLGAVGNPNLGYEALLWSFASHRWRFEFPAEYRREKPFMPRTLRLWVTDSTERLRRLAMMRSRSVPRIIVSASFHGLRVGEEGARMPSQLLRAPILPGVRLIIRASWSVGYFVSSFSSSGIHGSDLVALGNRPVL